MPRLRRDNSKAKEKRKGLDFRTTAEMHMNLRWDVSADQQVQQWGNGKKMKLLCIRLLGKNTSLDCLGSRNVVTRKSLFYQIVSPDSVGKSYTRSLKVSGCSTPICLVLSQGMISSVFVICLSIL